MGSRDVEEHKLDRDLDAAFSERNYSLAHALTAVHGVAHVDADGRFLDCNQAYCEILGRSKRDIIGKAFSEFTAQADMSEDLASARDVADGYINRYGMDKSYVMPDGKEVKVRLEVRRYPWDTREEFQHYVVHCYYKPEYNLMSLLKTNKAFGLLITGASGLAGAVAGNLDVVAQALRSLAPILTP